VETARRLCDIVTTAILKRTEARLARTLQDAASRDEAEIILRDSEKRYRQMADSMPQIVWTANPDGIVDYYNQRWYDFTLLAPEANGNIEQLHHPDDVQNYREVWNRSVCTGEPYVIEHRLWDAGRSEFRWHLGRAICVRGDSGQVTKWFGTCTDIDDHKRLSDDLEARVRQRTSDLNRMLIEKTTLLKEVHHRVKNNLQVVSSLLSLQIACRDDSQTVNELRVASERIHSMSLLHEQIYQSETLSDLDFGKYLEELALHLYQSYCPDRERIGLSLHTESVPLTIDQAIPCGLILNELVSNSLKHAFPGERHGLITIRFAKKDEHNVEMIVQDDGVGLGAGFDLESTSSMGVQVLQALTRQLGASLKISEEGGTRFALQWPLPNGAPRILPRGEEEERASSQSA
jgi:PAS domain S-box-containing protein